MADHEMMLSGGFIEWQVRCICEPDVSLGRFFYEASAKKAFKDHQKAKGVKPPVNHDIVLIDDLFTFGATCRCICGDDLGHFGRKSSAVLAWRKHSGK